VQTKEDLCAILSVSNITNFHEINFPSIFGLCSLSLSLSLSLPPPLFLLQFNFIEFFSNCFLLFVIPFYICACNWLITSVYISTDLRQDLKSSIKGYIINNNNRIFFFLDITVTDGAVSSSPSSDAFQSQEESPPIVSRRHSRVFSGPSWVPIVMTLLWEPAARQVAGNSCGKYLRPYATDLRLGLHSV